MVSKLVPAGSKFQSTRPVRDATLDNCPRIQPYEVSIHASRAGRDLKLYSLSAVGTVSIHASRAGRDKPVIEASINLRAVSIHASRAGRDSQS